MVLPWAALIRDESFDRTSQQLIRLPVELPTPGTKQKAETDRESKRVAQFRNGAYPGLWPEAWSPEPGAQRIHPARGEGRTMGVRPQKGQSVGWEVNLGLSATWNQSTNHKQPSRAAPAGTFEHC